MTSNQISYARYLEEQRSNLANEAETRRSNSAREAETSRANTLNYMASIYNADRNYDAKVYATDQQNLQSGSNQYLNSATSRVTTEKTVEERKYEADLNYNLEQQRIDEMRRHNVVSEILTGAQTLVNVGMKLISPASFG